MKKKKELTKEDYLQKVWDTIQQQKSQLKQQKKKVSEQIKQIRSQYKELKEVEGVIKEFFQLLNMNVKINADHGLGAKTEK